MDQRTRRLTRWAAYASVAVALVLIALKAAVLFETNSVSVLASLLDSSVDLIASLILLFAVHLAHVPADEKHRFGHGKAEPLAALMQSVLVLVSAILLVVYALDKWLHPDAMESLEMGIALMVLSLLLTSGLISFQTWVIARTDSTAIRGDRIHYLTDLATNILVAVSLVVAMVSPDQLWLDPVLGLVIAGVILVSAMRLMLDSMNQLLDTELPQVQREAIRSLILSHPQVRGLNDFRSYRSGPNIFIQCDLELDDRLTLYQAHAISEAVTAKLKKAWPHADVLIHQEPVSLQNDPHHHTWGRD
jgi:ferrous-iron efflux pump FieF